MAIDVETTTEESSIQSNRRRRRRRRLASKQPPGFFGTVLEALHPQAFLKAFRHVDDSDTTVFEENEPMPPELVQQVIFEASQQEANINIDVDRLDNLSELQRLVDDHHTYNR